MRKIAAIVLFLLVSLGISQYVYASDIEMSEIPEENKIVLSGYDEGNNEGVPAFINVFKRNNHLAGDIFSLDKAYADLADAEDKKSVLVFSDYTKTDCDGSFSFSIKIRRLADTPENSPISGAYVANIKCGDTEYQYDFQFVDNTEKQQREEALLTLGEIKLLPEDERFEALDALLEDNLYSFVNYMDLLSKVNRDKVHTMIHAFLEESDYDVTDPEEIIKYFKKLIVIEALNEGKLDTIKDYETELMISLGEMASWYGKKPPVDDTFKKSVTQRLSGRNIADSDMYEEHFKEALILEYVAKSDGIAKVRDIVNAFKTDIGVSKDNITDNALRNVMGKSYEKYSSLASALSTIKEEKPSSGNNTSSGGGGGGGAGGIYKIAPEASESLVKDESKAQFVDLGNAEWAREAIEKLYEENIVAGKSNTHFAPLDYITREEFIKLLVLASGINSKAESLPFEDVSESAWYYDFISIAYNNKITTGMTDIYFGIGENITRQDMAVMVCRMLSELNIDLEEKNTNGSFTDSDMIADYAAPYVKKLHSSGIMNGGGDGSFNPTGLTTRAEAAKVIYSLLSLLR